MSKIIFDLEEFRSWLEDMVYISDWDSHDRGYNLHMYYRVLDNGKFQFNNNNKGWKDTDEIQGEVVRE